MQHYVIKFVSDLWQFGGLSDYKQMIKNLFFSPSNGVNNGRWSICNCVHYFTMCRYEIIEKEESLLGFWTMLCALHLFCGNFLPIYSITLLLPMQQQAFPHQYLRSRPCFARTMCFKLHVYLLWYWCRCVTPKLVIFIG